MGVQAFGITAAIVTGEYLARHAKSANTPLTSTNLGNIITKAAAKVNSLLYQAGAGGDIATIAAAMTSIAYSRCADLVATEAAIRAMRADGLDVPQDMIDSHNAAIMDLLHNPRQFLADQYAAASHSTVHATVLDLTHDEDPVDNNDPNFTTETEW